MPAPELGLVHVIDGVGDSRMIVVHYKYPGEAPQQAVFMGSLHGTPGPIHLKVGGFDLHVEAADRFGETFDQAWVEKFYGEVGPTPGTMDAEHAMLEIGNKVGAHKTAVLVERTATTDTYWREPNPEDDLADREADRIDNLNFNREGL